MLTGIHFLLTYTCSFECDHCFLYCSPQSEGTFTFNQIKHVLEEAEKIGTVETIYFEGGEPFLFYPIMVRGAQEARKRGFEAGVVTNAYWALSIEDAKYWLKPLSELGIFDLSVSDDSFHYGDKGETPAKYAVKAAGELNIPVGSICIEEPNIKPGKENTDKGQPVIGGGALFKGRAADKLVEGLPTRPWDNFTLCPHEELENPKRVHIDSYGNVHVCQGVSMGNLWKTPLSQLIKTYHAPSHPICGPLIQGGPSNLARVYKVEHENSYVDECHLCYRTRLKLIDQFPEHLAPRQVYGLS